MKYNYEFVTLTTKPPHPQNFLAIRLPKSIALVEVFLGSDVQEPVSGKFFLEAIDKVLSGQEKYREVGGNVCILQISRDKTKVLDSLAADGVGNCCEIETPELKELILLWLKEQASRR